MVWIKTIPEAEASGLLAHAYRRQAATLGHPSDFSLLGSLDPNLVAARLELYRASERCPSTLTQRQRLIIAYVTSVLNNAPHCQPGTRRRRGGQLRPQAHHRPRRHDPDRRPGAPRGGTG